MNMTLYMHTPVLFIHKDSTNCDFYIMVTWVSDLSPSDRSTQTQFTIYDTPDESLLTAQPANFIITGILKVTLCVSL